MVMQRLCIARVEHDQENADIFILKEDLVIFWSQGNGIPGGMPIFFYHGIIPSGCVGDAASL